MHNEDTAISSDEPAEVTALIINILQSSGKIIRMLDSFLLSKQSLRCHNSPRLYQNFKNVPKSLNVCLVSHFGLGICTLFVGIVIKRVLC